MAGVIMLSQKKSAVPAMAQPTRNACRAGTRCSAAAQSQQRKNATLAVVIRAHDDEMYFTVTEIVSAQKMSDSSPRMLADREARCLHRFLECIQRARAISP